MRVSVYDVGAVFCLAFLLATVELIRRRKIEERYAILWLSLGFSMTVLNVFPFLLDRLSALLHVHYAPSLLFLIGLLFSLAFTLHLTMVLTKLQRKTTRLAQELALLKAEETAVHGQQGARAREEGA